MGEYNLGFLSDSQLTLRSLLGVFLFFAPLRFCSHERTIRADAGLSGDLREKNVIITYLKLIKFLKLKKIVEGEFISVCNMEPSEPWLQGHQRCHRKDCGGGQRNRIGASEEEGEKGLMDRRWDGSLAKGDAGRAGRCPGGASLLGK